MNVLIPSTPARPPLSETPFSREEGDEAFQPSQHLKALAIARQRTRDRGCKQQVRMGDVPAGLGTVRRWIVQDVR